MKTINTWLPVFPGFYGTIFESDNEEQYEIDEINFERSKKGLTDLKLDRFEFDYEEYQNRIAKDCVSFIEDKLKGFVEKIEFQEVVSPKEYNFANDSINIGIHLSNDNKKDIIGYILDHKEAFNDYIGEKYTSYDGFMSFYSNNPNDWIINFNDWVECEHELGSYLEFILWDQYDLNDLMYEMYESCEKYISTINYDELVNMEYCKECNEWVKPENFNGNCCNDCNDFSVQNFDRIVCTNCRDIIENRHETRHFTYMLKHGKIKPDELVCADCECKNL